MDLQSKINEERIFREKSKTGIYYEEVGIGT